MYFINLTIYHFVTFFLIYKLTCGENRRNNPLALRFILFSQPNHFHSLLAETSVKNIMNQVKNLNSTLMSVEVHKSHEDFGNIIGHWTAYPLFKEISELDNVDWIVFLEERTHLNMEKLFNTLISYNLSQDIFAGFALHDDEPTIIHHFDSSDVKSRINYPLFSAGFFINQILIKKLAKEKIESQFSIDPQYELAKFIKEAANVNLMKSPNVCFDSKEKEDCAMWVSNDVYKCEKTVPTNNIYVAVKTCEKFYKDRIPVVKKTWLSSIENVIFFSDFNDKVLHTVKLDVPNVDSGHCEKTLAIMQYYIEQNIKFDWLLILDDDTLLSFPRLQNLLACYKPDVFVALGERYGYGVSNNMGYNYLTGGSGMVFSMPTVKKLVESCRCPSLDSPDDMIIGLCLKLLNIPVIHSPYFHQARPIDYSPIFLGLKSHHVSFHKHWMIDPYAVYNEWLNDNQTSQFSEYSKNHSEL